MPVDWPPGVGAYSRGHALRYDRELQEWQYADDGAPHDDSRPCTVCKLRAEPSQDPRSFFGPDPCLGYLPGVDFACCGHGIPGMEYVAADGVRYDSVAEWRAATGHPE